MKTSKPIIIVSGLPRSGTSLMMQMLAAGGVPVLTDNLRQADANNFKGYYEFEPVKMLATDNTWLKLAQGKSIKVISHLLQYLPETYTYRIIMMKRHLIDVIQSQNKMLLQYNKPLGQKSNSELLQSYREHLLETEKQLLHQKNIEHLTIAYNELFQEPEQSVKHLVAFLGLQLDANKMIDVIDKSMNHFGRQW